LNTSLHPQVKKLIKEINLQNEDCFVSFDVVSLFTNVLVEEVSQAVRKRLNMDPAFSERSSLQVQQVMELLDICLTTTQFQSEDKFYQQKQGMETGNSNIFTEHFEETAMDTTDHKPTK
jgi:hypothetical protein